MLFQIRTLSTRVLPTGWLREKSLPLAQNFLISLPPSQKILPSLTKVLFPNQRFILYPLNNNFYIITQKFNFSCSYCFCTIFILTLYSLYSQVMLISILIDVQYLQSVVFGFEKGSGGQNYSF